MKQLEGRIALVTGSTRGIGRGIAESLIDAGAKVIVCGRSKQDADAVAVELCAAGGEARGLACDLLDEGAVGDLVPRALEVFGGLDILVNNAGGDADAPAIDYPLDKWRQILTLDLEVPFRLCQAAAQHFEGKGGGAIINVCSILGLTGIADACSYVAAKHGLVGVTKVLAIEWADKGIRVNAVAPGLIKTDLTKYVWSTEPGQQYIQHQIPVKRIGQPKDIGAAVVFLASDGADFIHGETIVVDGGYLAT